MLDTVKQKTINGIDLALLGEIAEGVENDPAKRNMGFEVTTRWTGGTATETRVGAVTFAGETIRRDHVIRADEPARIGGGETAANPQELLMAALNACITVGYVAGAAMRNIKLTSLEIVTKGELDLRGFFGLSDSVPPGYESLEFDVRIAGDGSPEEFQEIHQAVMATSPNYFNLSRPIRLNGALHVG